MRDSIEQVLHMRSARETMLDRAAEMFDRSDSEDDDGMDNTSPILDEFVNHDGNWIYKAMCSFTEEDFESLWDMLHVDFSSAWSSGRDPQSKTKPKYVFLWPSVSLVSLPNGIIMVLFSG